jgi:hypothetical protein
MEQLEQLLVFFFGLLQRSLLMPTSTMVQLIFVFCLSLD